ncbi:MAG TPA: hypothetical protein VFF30_16815 [Nitrososphaerales archaeon]|nr:hypothetical protein [Nitrososphaerales archaeon]
MRRHWHEIFALTIFVLLYVPIVSFFHFTYAQITQHETALQFDPLYLSIVFFAGFSTLCGSILPDILDPPVHWTHRKGAHSRKLLKWMGGSILIGTIATIFSPLLMIVPGFALGYLSHLIADMSTPAGLPP